MALLCGSQPKGLQRNLDHYKCNICIGQYTDSPVHILFECTELLNVRDLMWNKVISCMPVGMANDISLLNSREKYILIISGMKCTRFIQEWSEIFKNIAFFVHTVYSERKRKYDELAGSIE